MQRLLYRPPCIGFDRPLGEVDDGDAVACHVPVFRSVDPLPIRFAVPVGPVRLDHQITRRQVEIDHVVPDPLLLAEWFAQSGKHCRDGDLKAAGPGHHLQSQDARAAAGARPKAVDQGRLDHPDGSAHLAGHRRLCLVERMICPNDGPVGLVGACSGAPSALLCIPREGFKRPTAVFTGEGDTRLGVGVAGTAHRTVKPGEMASARAIGVGIGSVFRRERFAALVARNRGEARKLVVGFAVLTGCKSEFSATRPAARSMLGIARRSFVVVTLDRCPAHLAGSQGYRKTWPAHSSTPLGRAFSERVGRGPRSPLVTGLARPDQAPIQLTRLSHIPRRSGQNRPPGGE